MDEKWPKEVAGSYISRQKRHGSYMARKLQLSKKWNCGQSTWNLETGFV